MRNGTNKGKEMGIKMESKDQERENEKVEG